MDILVEFLQSSAALLIALIALAISLRANYTVQEGHKLNLRSKADSDRLLLFEKKRELLNEVDRKHTCIATLMMVTAQKILLFREHPDLHDSMQDEFLRLKSNLNAVVALDSMYEKQREGIEAINVGADIAAQDELLASIRRLTIHIEKDIAHEKASLDGLRETIQQRGAGYRT